MPVDLTVIGGTGAVGSTIIQMAQKLDYISKIRCADKDMGKADQFTSWANWSKIQFCPFDFGKPNEKQLQMLIGSTVIINAATFVDKANIKIMKIAQRLKAGYIGLASENDEPPAEEESFHKHFKKQQTIGMFNWGIGPGLTNLMARQLINGLEDCKVRIFVCELTDTTISNLFLWNIDSALNEARSPVPRFFGKENSDLSLREAFSEGEGYLFPNIGLIRCYLANENEGVTLSTLPNILRIQTKVGGPDVERLIEHVHELKKLLAALPKNALPSKIEQVIKKYKETRLRPIPSPKEIIAMMADGSLKESTVALSVDVHGYDPDIDEDVYKRVDWQSPKLADIQNEFPGKTPIQYVTAFMAMQAADRMFNSKSILPGVWPPEALKAEDRDIIFSRLKEKGMPVRFQ